jgi:hypothetical protein
MMALSPKPANLQVSRARCIGLQRTSSNTLVSSTGRIRSASRRPLSVNGMSVVPVCWPLRLHEVSPCLIANTFTFASRQQGQTLSASVERTAAAEAASCPHRQPVISGMSSP